MLRALVIVPLIVVTLAASTATAEQAAGDGGGRKPHDAAFWRRIAERDYAVPAGESAFALVEELDQWIGSPDPALRDDLGFTITAVWISYRPQLSSEQLIALLDRWRPGLMRGLDGATGSVGAARPSENGATRAAKASGATPATDDAVLARSFTALRLAALAERDLAAPFLGAGRYRTLLDEALAYLRAETDLRGFEREKGWFHATAHTADLLKYLARNPLLTPADQARILDGVADRLTTAPVVFTHGEQDRLAQALAAIVLRPDFDGAAFTAWLTRMRDASKAALRTRPLEPSALTAWQNRTHLLEALFARLSKGELAKGELAKAQPSKETKEGSPTADSSKDALTPAAAAARLAILEVISTR